MGFADHLDKATFDELKEIMEEDFTVLLETYLLDSDTKLVALKASFEQRELEMIREVSHGFKGSSLNIGAHTLAGLLTKIEDYSREADLDNALILLPDVIAEYQQVSTFITHEI
ncbi:MAG: chemotaxis protein histidine kinase CheA [Candidatus Azotimanducaceae bacterium]|jgi:chemotaxis protein histidine kinase CheA